uniref:Uncharacterized protein n=1 Tax=Haptolina brevifila TaxID=156173 RepID=A0A7S2N2R0_9EUKA|mmetsp:Transcript_64951/g.128400  ORF Transcript_64951/g.128400 Transcript_64951/m.128400 type:complete len:153 (+) Transcript_64951:57-515(+)
MGSYEAQRQLADEQRFVSQASYSDDPELDAEIKRQISGSRHTVADLKYGEIKRILRAYNVSAVKILEADTKQKVVDLAIASGIIDVPDEWTLSRLLQEQKDFETQSYREAGNLKASGVGTTTPENLSPELSPEYKKWVDDTEGGVLAVPGKG